jgi:hypothetical protein
MDKLIHVAIEVPCFALFALVVWKLGKLAIERWSLGDDARTKEIAKGFAGIVGELHIHSSKLERIETKLDTSLELRGLVKEAVTELVGQSTNVTPIKRPPPPFTKRETKPMGIPSIVKGATK